MNYEIIAGKLLKMKQLKRKRDFNFRPVLTKPIESKGSKNSGKCVENGGKIFLYESQKNTTKFSKHLHRRENCKKYVKVAVGAICHGINELLISGIEKKRQN